MARADVIATAAPFNAPTNGSTPASSALQAAINATPENGICVIPPCDNGYVLTTPLIVPGTKKFKLLGSGWGGTLLRQTAEGQDVIRFATAGVGTDQDRFSDFCEIAGFELRCNTGNGSTDYSPNFNRCTYEGVPIGPCGIVYDDTVLPSSANASRNETWPLTFCTIRDCTFSVTTKGTGHKMGGVYVSGAAYGWKWLRLRGDNMGVMIAVMLPGVRRILSETGAGTLNHSGGSYAANAEVEACFHTKFGTAPTGLSRRTKMFTKSPGAGTTQLALTSGGATINPTLGTAPLYVFAVEEHSDVFSPDGTIIDDITHYGGHCTFSIPQPEGLKVGRIDAYGQDACLFGVDAVASGTGSRDEAISCEIGGPIYAESPQTNPIAAAENFVKIHMAGGKLSGLQIRGTDASGGRPKVRLDGIGWQADGIYLLSSAGQDQPDLIVDGDGIEVRGLAHVDCTVTDNGSNNTIRVVEDDATAALHAVI
jgi:hypothetical protein